MPLFEFRCRDCAKQFTFLSGVVAGNAPACCPRCSSQSLDKLMSRFARGRSDDARMDAIGDKLDAADFENPRDAARLARELGRDMMSDTGEDIRDELEAMIEADAHGETDDGKWNGEDGASTFNNSANGDDGTIY